MPSDLSLFALNQMVKRHVLSVSILIFMQNYIYETDVFPCRELLTCRGETGILRE